MKPKPTTKPSLTPVIGRLIILHARAANMAERARDLHNALASLAAELDKLREDLRIKVEVKAVHRI